LGTYYTQERSPSQEFEHNMGREDETMDSTSTALPMENLIAESSKEHTGPIDDCKPAASSRNIHGYRWSLLVLSVLTSTFFFGLDNTVVADVQPAIIDAFGSIDRLPWISVAFLIGAASTNFF
jgi:hypothetical protein